MNKVRTAILLTVLIFIFGMVILTIPAFAEKSDDSAGLPLDWEEALGYIKKMTELIRVVAPERVLIDDKIPWGQEIVDYILGYDDPPMSPREREYFEKILKDLEQLLTAVEEIQKSITLKDMTDLINNFRTLQVKTPSIVFAALQKVESSEDLPEVKRQAQLQILTQDIGIDQSRWSAVNNLFDLYTEQLVNAMLKPYEVTIDGKPQSMMLLRVQYEYLRRKYHWEHQAIEEWLSFQCYAVGLLIDTLTIEKYSIFARIELIDDYNAQQSDPTKKIDKTSLEVLLPVVQGWLNTAQEIYGKKTDWLAKPHNENERYYWTPGHEMLFESKIERPSFPQEESENIGWSSRAGRDTVKCIKNTHRFYYAPVWSFWKPFFRPGSTRYATIDELTTIFNDYKGNKSLFEIFKQEGNMEGIGDDEGTQWRMIIDPSSHPLECHYHFRFKEKPYYTVEGYFLDSSATAKMPKPQKYQFAQINYRTNSISKDRVYIGIKLKRVNVSQPEMEDVGISICSETANIWPKADDDLKIEMDSSLGNVEAVFSDEIELNKDQYSVTNNTLSVSSSILSGLPMGKHTISVDAALGTLILDIWIRDYETLDLPANLISVGKGAFAGVAAEQIQFHDRCSVIENDAFHDCESLQSVIIPEGITSIGEDAFSNCPILLTVTVPESVTLIGDGAFSDCEYLTFICKEGSYAANYADENGIPHHE